MNLYLIGIVAVILAGTHVAAYRQGGHDARLERDEARTQRSAAVEASKQAATERNEAVQARAVLQANLDAAVAASQRKTARLTRDMADLDAKVQAERTADRERIATLEKERSRVVQSNPVFVRDDCRLPLDGVRVHTAAQLGVRLDDPRVQAALVSSGFADPAGGGRPAAVDGPATGSGRANLRPVPRVP